MARKKQSTALAVYSEELAALAQEAADQEAHTGGGQFFSTRGGRLSLNGVDIPGNEVAVVVLDSILVNAFYSGVFDPDNPQTPSCYAFGRNEDDMVPHPDSDEPQEDACADCPNNQFGSAQVGRGKACKNGRRLALIPAGDLDDNGDFEEYEDADDFAKGQVAYLNLAPTSINSYGSYVKQISAALKRPPLAVFTRVSLVEDHKTQFKITFENLGPVPDELIPVLLERHKEQRELITFPFPKNQDEEAGSRGRGGRGNRQTSARSTKAARKTTSKSVARKTTSKKSAGKSVARKTTSKKSAGKSAARKTTSKKSGGVARKASSRASKY